MGALSSWPIMTRGMLHVQLGTLFIALSLAVVAPVAARGETSEAAALHQEVTDLKQVIQHLNERVEGLEKQLQRSESAPQAAAAPATPVAQPSASATPDESIRARWQRIDHGMTVQDVEALLGHPQRTMTVNLKTVWYYAYPEVGSGSIVFAQDGGVDDWQTPPFNTWW